MIKVELRSGVYQGGHYNIVVRSENGQVVVFIDQSRLEFNTPSAFKLGFTMVKKAGEALVGDFVSLLINSKELQLLPCQALQVGGAMVDYIRYRSALRRKQRLKR
jgi:hypothetical protein